MPDRNEEYYLEDIIFQVEDQLFKVHRHLFAKLSPVFGDMFSVLSHGVEADGLTDKKPLVLEGVEKKDFVPLLRCLYPMQFPADSNISFTLEEWQSVLKLASLYEMAKVKTFVIEKMEALLVSLPSLQIQLAKAYNVKKWLAPGVYRLAERIKPLDEEDVRLVGLYDSLKICALREKSRQCVTCRSCGTHSGGFTLKDIGHAFDIHSSDLPDLVLGCEQSYTCSPPSKKRKPARTHTFQDPPRISSSSQNTAPGPSPSAAPSSTVPKPPQSFSSPLTVVESSFLGTPPKISPNSLPTTSPNPASSFFSAPPTSADSKPTNTVSHTPSTLYPLCSFPRPGFVLNLPAKSTTSPRTAPDPIVKPSF